MRLEKVDLNLFIVFDAIYRERSVTKVSQLLNLTQPAVSNALSRLRQTFNDQLFTRSPNGMMPTAVADNVIGDVRTALELLGGSIGTNARFDPAITQKTFKLGMNDLSEYLLLPTLMQQLSKQAPNAFITSYYLDRKKATDDLKSGALDLMVDAASYHVDTLCQQSLGKLEYVVAMWSNHPLANLGRAMTLEQYLSSAHLHVSSRRDGKGQMDIALQALGHVRNITMRVQNYQVAASVIEQNDLLMTVPAIFAQTKQLHCCALPFEVEPLPLNLYWHKSAAQDPANMWMRHCVEEIISQQLFNDA